MIINDGQNIFDVAISTGNINNLFIILNENEINVDSELTAGQEIVIPSTSNNIENFIISSFQNLQQVTNYIIKTGQTIFDLTLQFFGDIEQLFKFNFDNSFDISTILISGQNFIINNFQLGNESVKKFVNLNNLILCNSIEISSLQYLETESGVIITTEDGQGILV